MLKQAAAHSQDTINLHLAGVELTNSAEAKGLSLFLLGAGAAATFSKKDYVRYGGYALLGFSIIFQISAVKDRGNIPRTSSDSFSMRALRSGLSVTLYVLIMVL